MKKFFILSIVSLFSLSAFAFEGIIEQVYTDAISKEQKNFVWYISGDKLRLDIISGEESMTIIPNFSALSLAIFGNKADQDGNFWYSNSALSDIKVNAPSLRLLESGTSDFKGQTAQELKLMSDKGLVVVQYLNNIALNMSNMKAVFAESVEFGAIALNQDSGFPVSSMLMTNSDAIYTLTTKSITEKSLNDSDFKVPSNYKLFTGIK
ncbi:MAG: hypothetical protein H6579_02765 [Chitinophagales bacterium]|nr:hypothetical protein [Chitinophagales bacterium]